MLKAVIFDMMKLFEQIKNYTPANEQEQNDKEQMLAFMQANDNCLTRENTVAHFTTSIWTVNKERTKTLMVYHNIYNSWSWIGGHADGEENLAEVALRELQEETGVKHASLVSNEIFSIETLTVDGHIKKGAYVPCHLHFNVTYLAEADEAEALVVNEDENQAVKWFAFEEALAASTEPWMVEHVYKKLVEKSR
jgi:8-oxo-dGTP pyrophosphatase MutT (NUDIX family)